MTNNMNIFIYGSCVSRDIFRLVNNSSFNIVAYIARSSLASQFSGRDKGININYENIKSDFRRRCVKNDIEKKIKKLFGKNYISDNLIRFYR